MGSASIKLAALLDTTGFRKPAIPIVNNADALFLERRGEDKVFAGAAAW